MSLIQKLIQMNRGNFREEDTLTEIFASILRENSAMLVEFLQMVGVKESVKQTIDTQVSIQGLGDSTIKSRPDILITSTNTDHQVEIIVIESKIRSVEHGNQLYRYAEMLSEEHQDAHQRILIYLTWFPDPKDAININKIAKNAIVFKQLSWEAIYRLMKKYKDDTLVNETLSFMEENGMSTYTYLLPSDLSAFSSFIKLHKFMKDTLHGEVRKELINTLGIKPIDIFDHQMEDGRVILWNYLNGNKDWAIGLGYDMGLSGNVHPKTRLFLEINPDSDRWDEIASFFKKISESSSDTSTSWILRDDTQPENWTSISLENYLGEFISSENHAEAIKRTFILYLNQVKKIKEQYPRLPW